MENKQESQGMCCPISGCPIKKVAILAIAAFATIFGFQWLYHGVYMMSDYQATAAMWRPEEQMKDFMHICMISKGLMALAASGLFCMAMKSSCGSPCPVKGAKIGLLIGLLLGAASFSSYAWLPFETMDIPLKWLAGDVLMGVIVGAVLGLVSRMCKKDCA